MKTAPLDRTKSRDLQIHLVGCEDDKPSGPEEPRLVPLLPVHPKDLLAWLPVTKCRHPQCKTSLSFIPFMMLSISILQISMFYLCEPSLLRTFVYDPNHRSEVWRFLTYMLLHSNLLHLGLNVAIQCILAVLLEAEQGRLRTVVVYVGGGVLGSLGASVLDGDYYLVGSSAGVYALLIAHISNIVLNVSTLRFIAYRSAGVIILTVTDICFIWYHIRTHDNEHPRIGWTAHSSGALAGFLLGLVVFKSSSSWSRAAHFISAICLLLLVTFCITYNIIRDPPATKLPF